MGFNTSDPTKKQNGSQTHPQIRKKLIPDPHLSFLLLPWSPRVSPSCQNGPKSAKVEAPGLPNNTFWKSEIAISMPKVIAISENAVKTNLQKPTCLRTFYRKTEKLKTQETQQSSSASTTQPLPHSPLPERGAEGRGRSP